MNNIINVSILKNPDLSDDFIDYLIESYSEKLSTPITTHSEAIFIYSVNDLKFSIEQGYFDGGEDECYEIGITQAERDIINNCTADWIAFEKAGKLIYNIKY